MCVVHLFYMCVQACTRVYTHGLMSRVFFAFAHVCHMWDMCEQFILWVICTVYIYVCVCVCVYEMKNLKKK